MFIGIINNEFRVMKCVKCDTEIPEDSIFCPSCGNPTKNVAKDHKTNKSFIISFNLSLKKILVIIALGIWMLVLLRLGIIPVPQQVSGTVDIDRPVHVYSIR